MEEKEIKKRKKLSTKQKKIIKKSCFYGSMFSPTLVISGVVIAGFAGNDINGSFSTPEGVSVWIIVAFFAGFLFTLWYPISRLIAWMKTRTLKNKNLELDIEIKEKKLDALNEIIPDKEEIQNL